MQAEADRELVQSALDVGFASPHPHGSQSRQRGVPARVARRLTPWHGWQGSSFARVRTGSLVWTEALQTTALSERPLAFAMQKVEGSSPFIRFKQRLNPGRACPAGAIEDVYKAVIGPSGSLGAE
jgi:hypothetical protein